MAILSWLGNYIYYISDIVFAGKSVIKFLQFFRSPRLPINLEELNTDLPWFCVVLVEFSGRLYNNWLNVVARNTVYDDYNVEGLNRDIFTMG
jgi:hypothetical protein